MKKYTLPQLKLGSTSFLIPASFAAGFRFAAERCEDVSLLLLTMGNSGEYLIKPDEVREIARIIDGEGVTVNIHLPTDAGFDTPEDARMMVRHVAMVMDRTALLQPHTFVLHINFPRLENVLLGANPKRICVTSEQKRFVHAALRDISSLLPAPETLAIENLENFPPGLWDEWLENTPYSRCMDVGHIWKDGWNPGAMLKTWLPRTRIIHLHGLESRHGQALPKGIAERILPRTRMRERMAELFSRLPRDHRSLRFMPPEWVDTVLHTLWREHFSGVLNLEMFCMDDFEISYSLIMKSWERYQALT